MHTRYKIYVGDKRLKENVRAIVKANLFKMNVKTACQASLIQEST